MLQTEQAQKRLETDGSYQNSNEAIYFSIYKIINPKDDNKLSNKKYLDKDLREVANSDTYFYQREVSKRFELPADEAVPEARFVDNFLLLLKMGGFFVTCDNDDLIIADIIKIEK